MKKFSISLITMSMLAILLIAPAAQAGMVADISYIQADIGGGLFQYDFTVKNASSGSDSHPYLNMVSFDFEEYAYITLTNSPENWTVGSYIGDLPDTTDYVEMYSDAIDFDLLPGASLAISFTADWQIGEVLYEATFSDHGVIENWATVSGPASAVPVPAALWLLGSGVIGLVGIRRKTNR